MDLGTEPKAQSMHCHLATNSPCILKQTYQKSQHKVGNRSDTCGNCHPQQVQTQQRHITRTNLQTKTCFVNTGIRPNICSNTTGKVSRPAKGLRLEGAKPLNLMIVTHFQLFFQGPRAPKREPPGTPNHTKSRKVGTKKKH